MSTSRRRKNGRSDRRRVPDSDTRLLEALDHPTRLRALAILNRGVTSSKLIANELGLPVGTVGYHVRKLETLGCIELVRSEPRRGATEHFYRAIVPPSFFNDEQWAELSADSRMAMSMEQLKCIHSAITEALVARTFDARRDRHLSQTRARLDEQGWREIGALLRRTLQGVSDIKSQSADRERTGRSVGKSLEMNVVMVGFESPSSASPVDLLGE